jgi:hypothetical protein
MSIAHQVSQINRLKPSAVQLMAAVLTRDPMVSRAIDSRQLSTAGPMR